jgi:hypothetical protein
MRAEMMLGVWVGEVMRAEMKTLIAELVKEQVARHEAVDVYGIVQAIWHLPHICSLQFLADAVAREAIAQRGCLVWERRADTQTFARTTLTRQVDDGQSRAECHLAAVE